MASRPFFSGRPLVVRVLGALFGLALASVAGCVTVKPQDKELLADPAMIYGSGGAAPQRQEEHVLENREGATTGSAAGGGCGCN